MSNLCLTSTHMIALNYVNVRHRHNIDAYDYIELCDFLKLGVSRVEPLSDIDIYDYAKLRDFLKLLNVCPCRGVHINYKILPPSQIISKKNSFSLSQIISKKDQLLSYLIMFFQKIIFFKGKLNAKCIQFALFFIFSIINYQ